MARRVLWVLLFGLFLSSCALGTTDSGLIRRVEILETEVAQYQEYVSYQATQIGRQEEFIQYLATRGPAVIDGEYNRGPTPTLTPYDSWMGGVIIEGDVCCAGGTAGDEVELTVEFLVQSRGGEVTEMRVLVGHASTADIDQVSWEPYVQEKTYSTTLANNWTTFWVHVQFRDSSGGISEVFSDEIALEGMPPAPTETPQN
jgi:hypothetical protein